MSEQGNDKVDERQCRLAAIAILSEGEQYPLRLDGVVTALIAD